ncbi:MAG: hypothetical protein HY520_04390 [Candidatus Aenigmarchaeota archaeon]|nr:hypothetical protein [Candidatus Aenigmarchaeota archaeon]
MDREQRTLGEQRAAGQLPDYGAAEEEKAPAQIPAWYFRSCSSTVPPGVEDYASPGD